MIEYMFASRARLLCSLENLKFNFKYVKVESSFT